MLVRSLRQIVFVTGGLFLAGCSGDMPRPIKVQTKVVSAKDILMRYVETGELDSGTSDLQDMLETLKTTDASKGADLLSDLKKLKSLNDDANAIKAQARKMADKL